MTQWLVGSAGMRGERMRLKLYDDKTGKVSLWADDSGWMPYVFDDKGAKLYYARKYELPANPKYHEVEIRQVDSYAWDSRLEFGVPFLVEPRGFKQPVVEDLPFDMPDAGVAKRLFGLLNYPVPMYDMVAVDIETLSRSRVQMPDPMEAEAPIISVALAFSNGAREVWALRRGVPFQEVGLPDYAHVVNTEEEILRAVFPHIQGRAVVLTFNGDEFDMRYLRSRALRLGFLEEEIPIGEGTYRLGLKENGLHLDLMKWFDNRSTQIYVYLSKYKEMSLDAISKGVLGHGKVELVSPIRDLDLAQLIQYNMMDAELTLDLANYKDQFTMDMMTRISRVACIGFEDVCRYKVGGWLRSMLQREHRVRGILNPNPDEIRGGGVVTKSGVKGKKYKGAVVFEPRQGVYFGVYVLDFASLYPSLIANWNLGYETMNCGHDGCRSNVVLGTTHHVCRERRAISAEVIGVLKELRVRWYKSRAKGSPMEQTLKVLMNATYGVFANEMFPFYCPEVAESIASLGRFAIEEIRAEAPKYGYDPLYGDTDSVFVAGLDGDLVGLVGHCKSEFNLDLELDKSYVWLVLSLKKNYMGKKSSDGKVDVKGMVGKKSNTPPFVRGVFDGVKKILALVDTPEDLEKARPFIRQLVREEVALLRARKVDPRFLAVRVVLDRNLDQYKVQAQHVKVARKMEAAKAGTIVEYVKVIVGRNRKGREIVEAKELSKASRLEISVQAYEEMLRTALGQVLDAMGESWPAEAAQSMLM